MVGDARAGDATEVPADVESLGGEDRPQRLDRFDTAWAFWTVFGIMAAALVGMLAFFRLKRWL